MASPFAQLKMNKHDSGNGLTLVLQEVKAVNFKIDHIRTVMDYIGRLRKNTFANGTCLE